MNKDLDERLIQKGEYREAQNINIVESEGSDASAVENIRGNIIKNVGNSSISGSPEVIGYVSDVKNKRVLYFVTNFSGSVDFNDNIRNITRSTSAVCKIIEYDITTEQNKVILEGSFLNFSKNHLITGAQIIDDLLFFTDDYNQPRRINIKKAKEHTTNPNYYTTEDEISVARYAPYTPIRLLNKNGAWSESNTATSDTAGDKTNGNIKSDYLRENFVRFSYRYKYEDGEYSLFAPFTQIVFEPLNNGEIKSKDDERNATSNEPNVPISSQNILQTTKVDIMQNAINKVILRIPVPNANERGTTSDSFTTYANPYKISEVQIVLKESDSRAIKVVKNIKIDDASNVFESYSIKPKVSGSTTYFRQVLKHVYKSEKPFQVLPEDQTTRVFDQVPILAKSLEVVGNRVVFGNYVENYEFPKDKSSKKGMNYFIGVSTAKADDEWDSSASATKASGLLQYTHKAYKHHNIKQRRTYQVGIVFADKFGRQSPVVLSSTPTNNITDTFTVGPDVEDKKTKFNSGYSWSSNRVAYGQALKISFQDDALFANVKDIYNGDKTSADYNPHGWYSYRVVVKQTEQEYDNVYGNYAANSWSNIGTTTTSFADNGLIDSSDATNNVNNQVIHGKADDTGSGRSWFTLYGDNINKVPRNPSEQDFTREGISGSDTFLYPKVIPNGSTGSSKMGSVSQEPIDVISIGTATEQGLFSDNAVIKPATLSLPNKPRIYNFVYGKDRDPLVAELPNLKVEPIGVTGVDVAILTTNDINTDTPIGYPNDPNIDLGNSSQKEGLMVFETKPFESKIDIFYESGTCGLVEDLDDQLEANSIENGPDNVTINPTNGEFSESLAIGGTVVTVDADDNTTGDNLSFGIQNASTGAGENVTSRFNINSTTGVVTLAGGFRRKDNSSDTINVIFSITDPNSGTVYSTKTLTVTNSPPVVSGTNASDVDGVPRHNVNIPNPTVSRGSGYTVTTLTVENGSTIDTEDDIGLSVTHVLGNTNFNNYFSSSITGNTLTIKALSAMENASTSNAFHASSNSNRTMTVTVNDGLSSNNTSTANILISESTASVSGTLTKGVNTDCDVCNGIVQNFYAVANSGTMPTVVSGELRVNLGNQIYTDSSNNNNAAAGKYFYTNDASTSGSDKLKCVTLNSDGVVTSIANASECATN